MKKAEKAEFEVGDKVYCPEVSHKIFTIIEFYDVDDIFLTVGDSGLALKLLISPDETGLQLSDVLCHATPENHRMLGVEFEAPPAPKNPKEIIQAMLDDGWIGVACYVNDSDKRPSKHNKKDLIVDIHDVNDGYIFGGNAYNWKGANPFDPKTGKIIIDYVDGEIVTE